jgi:hypothetical protein
MHHARTLMVVLTVMSLHTRAAAEQGDVDPYSQLQQVREQFRHGGYEGVAYAAEQLLGTDPSMLVRAEALQYLGASLELLGRSVEAEEQFEVLATLQPQWAMNRSEFPAEVIALFDSVRDRVHDQLSRVEEQQRRAQQERQRERERQLLEEQRRLSALARRRYLAVETRPRHLALALLPFGAGQFQNDQRGKGYAFLGTELGLTVGSMTLWLLAATLPPPEESDDPVRDGRLLTGYQYASYAVYGALAVAVIWGIIDGLVHFYRARRRPDRWREVPDDEVPAELRLPDGPEPAAPPRAAPTPAASASPAAPTSR